jgi:hypothetical protein
MEPTHPILIFGLEICNQQHICVVMKRILFHFGKSLPVIRSLSWKIFHDADGLNTHRDSLTFIFYTHH